jgi:hypothetical protein
MSNDNLAPGPTCEAVRASIRACIDDAFSVNSLSEDDGASFVDAMIDDIVASLRKHPPFAALTSYELELILGDARMRTTHKLTTLIADLKDGVADGIEDAIE